MASPLAVGAFGTTWSIMVEVAFKTQRELKAVDMKLLSESVSNKIEAQRLFKRNVPVKTSASRFPPAVPTTYAFATAFPFPA
uniref:Uncharacterized protein n=1 Tax=Tanacetum cinerariifolium TaxID=118510 RepID=A0A699RRK5_TANCI|nr:hypothetical protein [Tanacetum cinerariifolium]